jgi:uncharacterized protein YggE
VKRTITVTGTGEVKGVPDIARVELGAEAVRTSVAEARAAASEGAAKLIESLKANGVDAKDMQTSRVSIQPQHEYPPNEPPKLTGYLAQNTVRVSLRDLDAAGAVIDAAVAAAGDAGRLNGISFAFSNPDALAAEARRRAVAAALVNARTLAGAAGVKVGNVLTVDEAGAGSPQPRMYAMRMEAMNAKDTPIEAGESSVTASVVVRYAIK